MASWEDMSNTATNWLQPLTSGQWDAPMALGGAGLSLAGNIGSIFEYLNQQKQYKDYQAKANAPVNWQQFYQPMTADYQRVMRNAIMAEAASRGLPADSGYSTGIMADSLAAKNNELMTKAMELGNQAKSTQLQGLSTGFAQRPSYAAALGSLGKFMDPLVAYRKQAAALAARKSLEGQYGPQTGQAVNNFYNPNTDVSPLSPGGASWQERMPQGPNTFYDPEVATWGRQ